MMRWLLVLALWASLIAGCGGGETLSNGQIATQSLISSGDLPSADGEEDGLPPEPCGPALIFEAAGGRSDETELLIFGEERVQEAIGVFTETGAADRAFADLTAEPHYQCIRRSVAEFNAGEEAVELEPVRALGFGDRDTLERFVLVGGGTQTQSYVDLEAIQTGRCVTSVILLSEASPPTDAVITDLSTTAIEPLEGNCG